MQTLRSKNLDGFVHNWIDSGRPYLGICLGLQLLFESSEESPGVSGLGILPGKVVKFRGTKRIPHMGWNTVKKSAAVAPYFKGLKADDRFYFVHSYFPVPEKKSDTAVTTSYGKAFCSGAARDNVFAVQFHPEKSGNVGLKLLKNILNNVKAGVAA
jgi:glutamine amidotransferase